MGRHVGIFSCRSAAEGLEEANHCRFPCAMVTWVKVANELREKLPEDVQETLKKHEKDGTTDSEEYEEEMQVYYERHVCRVKPFPQDLADSFKQLKEDPTVYLTM
jgi:L-proline amide hydrolase